MSSKRKREEAAKQAKRYAKIKAKAQGSNERRHETSGLGGFGAAVYGRVHAIVRNAVSDGWCGHYEEAFMNNILRLFGSPGKPGILKIEDYEVSLRDYHSTEEWDKAAEILLDHELSFMAFHWPMKDGTYTHALILDDLSIDAPSVGELLPQVGSVCGGGLASRDFLFNCVKLVLHHPPLGCDTAGLLRFSDFEHPKEEPECGPPEHVNDSEADDYDDWDMDVEDWDGHSPFVISVTTHFDGGWQLRESNMSKLIGRKNDFSSTEGGYRTTAWKTDSFPEMQRITRLLRPFGEVQILVRDEDA